MVSFHTPMALGALLLISYSALATAAVYTVGDSSGWGTGSDYSSWTSGKTFVVGDSLVFNYASSTHTVNEVTASDYSACSTTRFLTTDSSGTTTIALKTPGTHYFVCGVPGHCSNGMKLSVSVSSSGIGSDTPSATPATTNGGSGTRSGAAVRTVEAARTVAAAVVGALVGVVLV